MRILYLIFALAILSGCTDGCIQDFAIGPGHHCWLSDGQ
jgi:hypothetical protein